MKFFTINEIFSTMYYVNASGVQPANGKLNWHIPQLKCFLHRLWCSKCELWAIQWIMSFQKMWLVIEMQRFLLICCHKNSIRQCTFVFWSAGLWHHISKLMITRLSNVTQKTTTQTFFRVSALSQSMDKCIYSNS